MVELVKQTEFSYRSFQPSPHMQSELIEKMHDQLRSRLPLVLDNTLQQAVNSVPYLDKILPDPVHIEVFTTTKLTQVLLPDLRKIAIPKKAVKIVISVQLVSDSIITYRQQCQCGNKSKFLYQFKVERSSSFPEVTESNIFFHFRFFARIISKEHICQPFPVISRKVQILISDGTSLPLGTDLTSMNTGNLQQDHYLFKFELDGYIVGQSSENDTKRVITGPDFSHTRVLCTCNELHKLALLCHEQNYVGLIKKINRISIKQEPHNVQITLCFMLGIAYFNLKNFVKAKAYLLLCKEAACSTNEESNVALSLCNAYLGDIELKLKESDLAEAYVNAAKCYRSCIEHCKCASPEYVTLFGIVPPSLSDIHCKLGDVFRKQCKPLDAIREYQTGVKVAQCKRDRDAAITKFESLRKDVKNCDIVETLAVKDIDVVKENLSRVVHDFLPNILQRAAPRIEMLLPDLIKVHFHDEVIQSEIPTIKTLHEHDVTTTIHAEVITSLDSNLSMPCSHCEDPYSLDYAKISVKECAPCELIEKINSVSFMLHFKASITKEHSCTKLATPNTSLQPFKVHVHERDRRLKGSPIVVAVHDGSDKYISLMLNEDNLAENQIRAKLSEEVAKILPSILLNAASQLKISLLCFINVQLCVKEILTDVKQILPDRDIAINILVEISSPTEFFSRCEDPYFLDQAKIIVKECARCEVIKNISHDQNRNVTFKLRFKAAVTNLEHNDICKMPKSYSKSPSSEHNRRRLKHAISYCKIDVENCKVEYAQDGTPVNIAAVVVRNGTNSSLVSKETSTTNEEAKFCDDKGSEGGTDSNIGDMAPLLQPKADDVEVIEVEYTMVCKNPVTASGSIETHNQTVKENEECDQTSRDSNAFKVFLRLCHKMNRVVSQYFRFAETITHIPFIDPVSVLVCDHRGIEHTLAGHDITLNIPEGAIPRGKVVHIEMGVALYGPFDFPNGTRPISPILWICPRRR